MVKSSNTTSHLSIGKDIDIMRGVTAPPIVGDVIASLYVSLITNEHLAKG